MPKYVFVGMLLLVGGIVMTTNRCGSQGSDYEGLRRVLLLGASVGKQWELPKWPERMRRKGHVFEMVAVYSFDKTPALEEIFMRPKRRFHPTRTYLKSLFKPAAKKPQVIIFKECAAYFPGDMDHYKKLVRGWVNRCIAVDIKPVLATVVPVTEEHSQNKPNRLKEIIEFNDWIREYSKSQNIFCLDLEAELRISDANRSLRSDLATEDGLHLNKKAYVLLDSLLLEKLESISQ